MPAFNAAQYIGEAIESILAQDFESWQLVVANDGSTDATRDIVNGYQDPRIALVSLPENQGIAAARNAALNNARGEYIAFLDADDRMLGRRLQKQLSEFKQNPQLGICGGQIAHFSTGQPPHSESSLPLTNESIQAAMLFYNPFATSTVMVRSKAFDKLHFRREFPPMEDYDMWQRITQRWKSLNLRDVLAEYRTHERQASATPDSEHDTKLRSIRGDRLRAIIPQASDGDIDLHEAFCNRTYWNKFSNGQFAIDHCSRLTAACKEHNRELRREVASVLRRKLIALTHLHHQPLTLHDARLFCRFLLSAGMRTDWCEACNDFAAYVLTYRKPHLYQK